MKCYYEVLQLERNCSLDEVKRAYKKLALKWHPDKNLDRSDECQAQFTLIQQAYDVLSDHQERAWYDRHREKILKGGIDGDYQDNAVNIFPYFAPSCYQGFGDDEKGFYTIYRHLFETIAAEDLEFEDNPAEINIPGFGYSNSDFDTIVGPFYGHWQSYTTSRSYVWKDKYDFQQAPDRRTWRLMEKENKKLRSSAKKERNELVRELVAFVRKRDKRVASQRKLQEERRAEQLKRVDELAQEQRRLKLLDLKTASEGIADRLDSQHLDALDEIEAGWESGPSTSDDESEGDPYCIACEKSFRSVKALKNHQKSKKHVENVEILRETLQKEDMHLLNLMSSNVGDDDDEASDDGSFDPLSTQGGNSTKVSKKSKRRKKKNKSALLMNADEKEGQSSSEDEKVVQNGGDILSENPVSQNPTQDSVENEVIPPENGDNEAPGPKTPKVPPPPVEARCKTCGEEFPSKSKLFKHLNETKHAAIRPEFLQKAAQKQTGKNKRLKR